MSRVFPLSGEANVFMGMSVRARQALEHHIQPPIIRTRLFDLLHYPVITQTEGQGLVLISLRTTEGNFKQSESDDFIVMAATVCSSLLQRKNQHQTNLPRLTDG